MSRSDVRSLKRAMRSESHLSSDVALALLDRSIRFGHGRLAIVRLVMAIDAGAPVSSEQWAYCSRVAQATQDPRTQVLYRSVALKGMGTRPHGD